MGDRATKDAFFEQFAAVCKVLGNPTRLELLDLPAQGPRSVNDLATAAQAPARHTCKHCPRLVWSTPAARASGSSTSGTTCAESRSNTARYATTD